MVRTRPVTEAAAPAVVEVTAPFHWAQIESTDYRAYIANLRAIGCPEATIHDIVEADVNDLFSGRVKQMVDGVTGLFWNMVANPKEMEKLVKDKMQELDSLDDQRRQMMRELFVEDDPQSKVAKEKQRADLHTILKWQLASLPEEKVAQIQDVYDRFDSEWAGLRMATPLQRNNRNDSKNGLPGKTVRLRRCSRRGSMKNTPCAPLPTPICVIGCRTLRLARKRRAPLPSRK